VKAFALLLALHFVGIVFAQSNPYVAEEVRATNGWKRRLKIEVEPNAHVKPKDGLLYITGTNINVKVVAEFPPLTSEDPPGPLWTHHSIVYWEMKIGGALIKRWEPGEVPVNPPAPPGDSHAIRFASTHFADNSDIAITLEAKFKVWNDNNPPDVDEDLTPLTVSLPLKVYNKTIALATVEGSAPVVDTAKRRIDDAIVQITGTAINYKLVDGNGDGTEWRESEPTAPRLLGSHEFWAQALS
jgi:hypothetical protein